MSNLNIGFSYCIGLEGQSNDGDILCNENSQTIVKFRFLLKMTNQESLKSDIEFQ